MSLRVLVTGGCGFLGSHVVDELVGIGCEVQVVDCLIPQVHSNGLYTTWMNPKAAYHFVDVRDRDAMTGVLTSFRPQCVVHLAAEVGVGQAEVEIERYVDGNVRAMAVLLETILQANDSVTSAREGIGRLIVAGSMSSYGEGSWLCQKHGRVRPARMANDLSDGVWNPRCPYEKCDETLVPVPTEEWMSLRPGGVYALTKRDQEELALLVGGSRGLSVAVPRFFNLYGPRQSPTNPYTGVVVGFGSRVRSGLAPRVYEDGEQLRDFTHVSDAARAVRTLVGSWQVAAAWREWSKTEQLGTFNVGTGQPLSIGSVASMACKVLNPSLTPEIPGMVRIGDIRACYAHTGRLAQLGWQPVVDPGTGVVDYFMAMANEPVFAADLEAAHKQAITSGIAISVEQNDPVSPTPAAWS